MGVVRFSYPEVDLKNKIASSHALVVTLESVKMIAIMGETIMIITYI